MLRRDFLKTASLAVAGVASTSEAAESRIRGRVVLESFDYDGVRLRPSRWLSQLQTARDFYLDVSDDDILHGWRVAAGLPAPGNPLGGWCGKNSNTVFGQWLSGMARLYRATNDAAIREKAGRLLAGWAKTLKPDGDCRMNHYPFEKLVCGLVDMHVYGGHPDALPLLLKATSVASNKLARNNIAAAPWPPDLHSGKPGEWYTLSENLYRAYIASGRELFREFGDAWLYPAYWNKFAETSAPADAWGVHAYSHVNTFSSAAKAYEVTGDATYLNIIRNFYDYMRNTQCYATGGYGPNERFMTPDDGSLGRALETRSDTFETLCGSWAAFKLSRYLMQFTGEARYGDWIERLFYNGAGAALPLRPGGRNFYYSDYRTSGGIKTDYWENFTCCSGTYLQDMADYHNLIYYKDATDLYVNLYVPSEVQWGGRSVMQQTDYPEGETSTLTVSGAGKFGLHLRVPAWSREMSVALNAVDRWHPRRVAVMRGPVVLALDYNYHAPYFELPRAEADLGRWLVADESPAVFRVNRPDGRPVRLKFRPFYQTPEDFPYLVYFDLDKAPYALW